MTKREPITVLLLGIVTCGLYAIWWWVQTKEEMNALGAQIPTAWLLLVPVANLFWLWKYAEGVEKVTKGKAAAAQTFLLHLLCGFVGIPLTVKAFNEI